MSNNSLHLRGPGCMRSSLLPVLGSTLLRTGYYMHHTNLNNLSWPLYSWLYSYISCPPSRPLKETALIKRLSSSLISCLALRFLAGLLLSFSPASNRSLWWSSTTRRHHVNKHSNVSATNIERPPIIAKAWSYELPPVKLLSLFNRSGGRCMVYVN